MKLLNIFCALTFGLLAPAAWTADPATTTETPAAPVAEKIEPLLSHMRPDLTLGDAYTLQRAYILRLPGEEQVGGFKAGLMTALLQKQFHAKNPVTGVLLKSGRHKNGDNVSWTGYRRMMIETEIAFIVSESIQRPLKSVASLRKHIGAVAPAFDLPNLSFSQPEKATLIDIVADNLGAKSYVIGEEQPLDKIKLDDIKVTLHRDGQVYDTGDVRNLPNGALQAALWLVNSVITRGYTVPKGQVLLTGALGKMLPAEPGSYDADFGELGKLAIVVK
jgi:2-keto-4-pentenoate hydratase